MNVEAVARSPLLPSDSKWAIRFKAGGLTTIVVGRRDFGNASLSAHFAQLVAARLGIPFGRVRLYYSATLPAVLQTPQLQSTSLSGRNFSPVAAAAVYVVEKLCDQVIEKVRQMATAGGEADFSPMDGRLRSKLDHNVFKIVDVDRDALRAMAAVSKAA
jgi:CO/xanthine dehydrogenase Mo-binding subunit